MNSKKIKLPNWIQILLLLAAAVSIWLGMNQLPISNDNASWNILSVAVIFYSGFILGRAVENWKLMEGREYPLRSGIYAEHPHPIYLGTFLLFAGISMMLRSSYGLIFSTLMGVWLVSQSIKEGRELKDAQITDRQKREKVSDKGST